MKLISLKYSELEKTNREWRVDELSFEQSNLLVGKNATGKTRAINVIHGLTKLLSGRLKQGLESGHFIAKFENEGKKIHYEIQFSNSKVVRELFKTGSKTYLDKNGKSTIFFVKIGKNGESISFQPPEDEISAYARRDSMQHPYFEPLYEWASSARFYPFGSELGRGNLAVFSKNSQEVDDSDFQQVAAIFQKGKRTFKEKFVKSIVNDMASVNYFLDDIDLKSPIAIKVQSSAENIMCLVVKEKDLLGYTDQLSMSQGMFRALSVIVQINYLQFAKKHSCVLIDDIGEGLDFDRSCKLIDLIRAKASKSNFQLIMTTNDRFVMNKVPLEEWSVLSRQGHHVSVFNYKNSKEIFDDFKFTGLSNFDFLSTDFINEEK